MADIHAPGFVLEAGTTGVLLLHGFTASPTEMRPLGEFLHRSGFTVLGVRLEGHGTSPDDLARTSWQDWLASAAAGLWELEQHCDPIFAVGLSMGAVLAAVLAERSPGRLRALCFLAPAFRLRSPFLPLAGFLRPVLRSIGKGSRVRAYLAERGLFSYPVMPVPALVQLHHLMRLGWRILPRVCVPVQVVMGARDRTIQPASGGIVLARLPSGRKSLVLLPGSGHLLTTEPDADAVFTSVTRFVSHGGPA